LVGTSAGALPFFLVWPSLICRRAPCSRACAASVLPAFSREGRFSFHQAFPFLPLGFFFFFRSTRHSSSLQESARRAPLLGESGFFSLCRVSLPRGRIPKSHSPPFLFTVFFPHGKVKRSLRSILAPDRFLLCRNFLFFPPGALSPPFDRSTVLEGLWLLYSFS